MNVFIAGGTGAIGRFLVPLLVSEGHRVVGMTRSAEGLARLQQLGAHAVRGDVYDAEGLARVVADAKPDVVIHQLTAFGATAGDPLQETIRIRTEGTRNLVAAAQGAGARRFIAQSISFICAPGGGGLTDEQTPLYVEGPPAIRPLAESVAALERQALQAQGLAGLVLRYGWFYGPGTNYDPSGSIPASVRKGRASIVGAGAGTYSFISLRDAALATLTALRREATGLYNIVDDEPAPLNVWLPSLAAMLGAPAPRHTDEALAREKLGDLLVFFMTEQRGASNEKAKRELGWRPTVSSWRTGFAESLRQPTAQ